MKNRLLSLMLAFCVLMACSSCSLRFWERRQARETTSTYQSTSETTSIYESSNESTHDSELVSLDNIPAYDSEAYVSINDNVPFFLETEYTLEPFETYSDLDSLGRCGVCYANVCVELMPAEGETRGSISSVKPTGWINGPN